MKTSFLALLWVVAVLPAAFGQWYAEPDNITSKYYHIADGEKNLQIARQNLLNLQKKKKKPNEAYLSALYELSIASKRMNLYEDSKNYIHWADRYATDTLKNINVLVYTKIQLELGFLPNAMFLTQDSLDILQEDFSKHEYFQVGQYYMRWNDYDKARFYIEKHLEANPNLEQKDPIGYAFKIKELAWIETLNGNYRSADSIFQHALNLLEAHWKDDEYEWSYFLEYYINFLIQVEDRNKCKIAIGQFIEAIRGKETVGALNRIGLAAMSFGEYYLAEKMFTESLKLAEDENVKPENIVCLYNNLANACSDIGKYQNVKPKNIVCVYNNLANARSGIEKSQDAVQYQEMAINIVLKGKSKDAFVEEIWRENLAAFFWFNNLARNYINIQKFDEALVNAEYANRISNHFTSEYAKEHKWSNIKNMIQIYDATAQYEKLDSWIEILTNQLIITQVNRRIQMYGGKSSEQIELFYDNFITAILTKRHKHIKNSGGLLYDYALLYKSSRLKLHLEELGKLHNNKDTVAQQLYHQWRGLQKEVVNSWTNDVSYKIIESIQNLEKQLSSRLKLRQDTFQQSRWQDIQQHLGKDSMAIEFIAVTDYNSTYDKCSDTASYYAIVLTPNLPEPQIIPLFKHPELLKLKEQGDNFYNSPKAYTLIWEKIEPFAKGMRHICYTPAGWLHDIVLPQIKTPQGDYLIDRYQWHLLTSTNLLTQAESATENLYQEQIAIAANINYETSVFKKNLISNHNKFDLFRGDSTYTYLSKSPIEADSLQQICERNACFYQTFSGQKATETNIKTLITMDVQKPTVLIFSTHAFFNPRDTFTVNFGSLARCGIALTGANQALRDKKIYVDSDEGIWTGYEIAESNLLKTKLVILSACETGKGDVDCNEGIYGLHQAFKLAGAHYILASREKVYDGDAKDFVITFFRKATEGKMSIAAAFHQTQLEMKRNGRTWANWVLIK